MSTNSAVVLERSSTRKRLTVTLTIEQLVIGTLLVLLVGVVFATARADAVQKAAAVAGDTCPYCGLPLTGEITNCHTACLERVILDAGQGGVGTKIDCRVEANILKHAEAVRPTRARNVNRDTGD